MGRRPRPKDLDTDLDALAPELRALIVPSIPVAANELAANGGVFHAD
jgi:hypothetical protein